MKRQMSPAGATTGERAEALAALYRAVSEAVETGQSVPCVAAPDLWISEDHEEQEAAAYRCQRCPALAACERYIDAFEERAGVWAARTPSDRKTREEGTDQ